MERIKEDLEYSITLLGGGGGSGSLTELIRVRLSEEVTLNLDEKKEPTMKGSGDKVFQAD